MEQFRQGQTLAETGLAPLSTSTEPSAESNMSETSSSLSSSTSPSPIPLDLFAPSAPSFGLATSPNTGLSFQSWTPSAFTATSGTRDMSASSENRRRSRRIKERQETAEQAPAPPPPPTSAKRKRAPASLRKKPPPPAPAVDEEDQKPAAKKQKSDAAVLPCCICMEEPQEEEAACISGCPHRFCFDCIDTWAKRENTCPLCKKRFVQIRRLTSKRKKGKSHSKRVKKKDQQADMAPGAALQGLLMSLARSHSARTSQPNNIARLVFSSSIRGPPQIDVSGGLFPFAESNAEIEGPEAFRNLLRSWASDDDASFFARRVPGTARISVHGAPINGNSLFATQYRMATLNGAASDRSGSRENPVEIDDSDDDDGEVEVVEAPGRC